MKVIYCKKTIVWMQMVLMSVKDAAPPVQNVLVFWKMWKNMATMHPPMLSASSWSWLSPSPVASFKQTMNNSSCCLKQSVCGVQCSALFNGHFYHSIIVWFIIWTCVLIRLIFMLISFYSAAIGQWWSSF